MARAIIAALNAKRYTPLSDDGRGGFTGAEVTVLARIVAEHGNPHRIPSIDTLAGKVETMARLHREDRNEAYR